MERVVSINLNGNSYQLDESAYDALRAYMDGAERALAASQDKTEIIRDLEQAIADKCASSLSTHKSVVSLADMKRALEQMGPVEGAEEPRPSGAEPDGDDDRPQRRLYRIYDRHAWTGVSAGMAAYAGIDVAWVRVFWILSAIFSGGFTAILYIVMIFAVPVAQTAEDMAAAHGAPFNAQEVIDRAKREYSRVAEESARGWRRRRHWREPARSAYEPDGAPPAQAVGYVTRIFAGLLALILSVIGAALLIAFLVTLFSLLSTGAVFGWLPPVALPIWLAIVIICIVYAALATPLRHLRRGSYAAASGTQRQRGGGGDDFITLLAILVGVVLAYQFIPDSRDWVEMLSGDWPIFTIDFN